MFQATLPALGLLLLAAPALRAQVTGATISETASFNQVSPTALAGTGFYSFHAQLSEARPGDVGTATLTYPGPFSPLPYRAASPTTLSADATVTQADFNTDFPLGAYTTHYSGGTAGDGHGDHEPQLRPPSRPAPRSSAPPPSMR